MRLKTVFCGVIAITCAAMLPHAHAQSTSGLRSSVNEMAMPSMGLRSSYAPRSVLDANPLAHQLRGSSFAPEVPRVAYRGNIANDPSYRRTVHDPMMAMGFGNSSTYAASQDASGTAPIRLQDYAEPGTKQNARLGAQGMRATQAEKNTVQASMVRRKRTYEESPYDPVGLHWGAFMVYPAIEFGAGMTQYKSANSTTNSGVYRVLPEVRATSLWSRHALNVNIRGGFDYYDNDSYSERPFIEIDTAGRYDFSATQTIDAGLLFRKDRETTSSLDAQLTGAAADVQTMQARASYTQDFGYMRMALRTSQTHYEYDDATSSSGAVIRNSDRNFLLSEYAIRGSYNRGTLFAPFGEVVLNTRAYDEAADSAGYERGSAGWAMRGGIAIAQGKVLSGELGVGYMEQTPDDPRFVTLRAAIIDGTVTWKPTALTTIIAAVSTNLNSTPTVGSSGYLTRRADVTIRHALQRNLVLSAGGAVGQDVFQDIHRTDDFYEARAGVDYFFNRFAALRLIAKYENRTSSITGSDTKNTTVEARIRLQR